MGCHDEASCVGPAAHIPVPVLEAVELADEEVVDEEDDEAVVDDEDVDDAEELDVVPEPPPPPEPPAGTNDAPPGSSNSGLARAPLQAASAKIAKKNEARFIIESSTRKRRVAKFFAGRAGARPRLRSLGFRHRSPRHAIARP